MKNILLIFFFFAFITNNLHAQIDSKNRIIDMSLKENILLNDSSFSNILEIPFLDFDFNVVSSPGIFSFLTKNDNHIIIDLQSYKNNLSNIGYHYIDIHNHLLYYAFRNEQIVYSFGIDHRLFAEVSLSKELISLLIDGNYQYINQTIHLDNSNYSRAFNYFSIFFGYSKMLEERYLLNAKFKIIKGVASFGIENRQSSILFSDNFGTDQNPFSSDISIDGSYFINSDYKLFSNLGFALDLYFDYDYNDNFTFYTNTYDLGFIVGKENTWEKDANHTSQDFFPFDGIDYILAQDTTENSLLSAELTNLTDSISNIFNQIDSAGILNEFRLLPFSIHFGANYIFNNENSQFSIDYSIKKLYNSILHTGKISYLYSFDRYDFSIIPSWSFNKFNYTNLSIFLHKKWKNKLHSSIYFNNIINAFNKESGGKNLGFGWQLYFMF